MSWNADVLNGICVNRSLREELIRKWSLAWQPMDAETLDIYVELTDDQPMDLLVEALTRLARSHSGPYRPAPADVLDRCWNVRNERNAQPMRHPQLEEPRFNVREIWQRCLDRALDEGADPDGRRVRFFKAGLARHAGLTDLLEEDW